MILSFKTEINGKPTYFVEKIHKGLRDYKHNIYGLDPSIHYPPNYNFIVKDRCLSKIHTIRKDEKNRWKPGMMIDFFINARQRDMFQFAPRIQVVSEQDVFMTVRGSMLEITIAKVGSYIGGDDFYLDAFQKGKLAQNDGFDDYNDFRTYFINAIKENGKKTGNYWFSGKIIHWTDYQY